MGASQIQHTCVFGLGWGDEGKGKVVDLLCPLFEAVVRFNGGANAGHTVCVGEEAFAMHLLPTGIIHAEVTSVIGPGVVADPIGLIDEIDRLAARGVDVAGRLKVSDRAHLVLRYHKLEDQLCEKALGAEVRIGTTSRGIGPCYADKMRRTTAVRFADLIHDADLEKRVRWITSARVAALRAMFGPGAELDEDGVVSDLRTARARLARFVCDTTSYLQDAMKCGRPVLFEGANGLLLDVDHGTYPFVTSSSTGPHGIGAGAGVSPALVTKLIGTTKAYSTRVGSGPFMTELADATGDRIRRAGNEYGTTTGRPRRCGWFDSVACRYSARFSGATDIAMMHLDTLSGFDEVGICVAYRLDGDEITAPPACARLAGRIDPVIEMQPGWHEPIRGVRRFEDLPTAARSYVERIETLVGVPVALIGVGPDRSETLVRGPLKNVIDIPASSAA